MKKFLLKIFLFSLLLFIIIIIGFVLPITPRASISLLNARVQKDSLLRVIQEPRIIFVGGSNLSFGLNSQLIKDSLSLNPINTAIHAGIGLEYMMDNILQKIKKGDIVIIAPEYEQFYGRAIYGREALLRTVADISFFQIFSLKNEQLKNVSNFLLKYSFSKFKPTEYILIMKNKLYLVNSFNKYGDAYAHWKMDKQKFSAVIKITEPYNPDAIKLIFQFERQVKEKGAVLFITFPGLQATSFNNNIPQIKRVENVLKNNGFMVLGTPQRYRIPDTMMFNTPYHLSKEGVDYRTIRLIEDIKKHKHITMATENLQIDVELESETVN